MRASFFLLLVLLFNNNPGFSQHRLKGFLGVEGGESFTYILEFTDSSGHIKGHSYTYRTEKKEVKARIEGLLDRENRLLRFKEEELIYNHGFESNATICLIQATLKFVKEDDNLVFKGPITTSDITNVSCSAGTIVMSDVAAAETLFEKKQLPATTLPPISQERPSVKPVRYVYDTTTKQIKASRTRDSTTKITEGRATVLHWQSDTITLYIWDGGKIDGDRVSVQADDKSVLSKYTLSKEKKRIVIPFGVTQMTLTVKAENEGNELPNTADLLFIDGEKQHHILTYNTAGKVAKVQIIKK